MRKCLFILFLVTVSGVYAQQIPWKTSSPEAQGMNSRILADGINELQQKGANIHSLLVIRNNQLVLDAAFYPYRQKYPHDVASVTKSVMALLVGIAIDMGFINSEEDPVLNYFPEHAEKNDTLNSLKIKDLLNMASGFQCSGDNREKELSQMRGQADWAGFMLDLPFASDPGERFAYCSGNYYLLAELLQTATKMTCHEFARKYLFDPLGFSQSYWESNKKGVNHGWGDLHITPYDLARIGSLLLKDGQWNGRKVISPDWIRKIKPLYYAQKTESYGYGWWLDSENTDEIQAIGRGGQRLFVFKGKNIIIVATGGGFEAGDMDNLVMNAVAGYKPEENHHDELLQWIKRIQLPDTGQISTDNFSERMLNRTFHLEHNDLGITGFRFEKWKDDYKLIFDFENGLKGEFAIGMGKGYQLSYEPQFGLPAALKSYWEKDQLKMTFNDLCRINLYRFSFVFQNDDVYLNVDDLTNKRRLAFKGMAAH